MESIHILIGGDVCPRGIDIPIFAQGDSAGIFHDMLDEFRVADLSIVNLECPLTDLDSPIPKCGPALRAPSACIAGLRNAGIHVLNLANNHILDHGTQGAISTLRLAESADIATVGAGRNLEEARRILIRQVGDMRIAILGIAEHEFSIAGSNTAGANPLDLIDTVRNISASREEWDYLIVLLHGGNEGYPYPSPHLMDTCRFLVEQGANAVICQHSHCVGCYEDYCGGHIVYGQGNLIFQNPDPPARWNEGVLIWIHISSKDNSQLEFVPFEHSKHQAGARKLKAKAAEALLEIMGARSREIQDNVCVQERWRSFCEERANYYLSSLLGHGRILSRLNRYGHVVKWLYSAKALLRIANFVRCEAHREVLEAILDVRKI